MNKTAQPMPLGIDGFTYADLYEPSRLRDLYELFCERVAAADPDFWRQWDVYRANPDNVPSPIERSDLIVRMAPHVSRFVATLFGVDQAAASAEAGTHSLDPLFRFKIDFVRKRALPLVKGAVKGGAHVHVHPADEVIIEELARPWAYLDRELAIASAGCALLDRETVARANGTDAEKADIATEVDALMVV